MAGMGVKWRAFKPLFTVIWSFMLASIIVSAERSFKNESLAQDSTDSDRFLNFLWQNNKSGYQHVWPELEFGWKIIVGSIIGFLGAAFGSVGWVGGGGIFVPMLTLIIGFDAKSATAMSKCKATRSLLFDLTRVDFILWEVLFISIGWLFQYIWPQLTEEEVTSDGCVLVTSDGCLLYLIGMIMGAAASTVYYNLKLRHPTLDMPIIDYDLAVLIQPMLMMGINIGVAFNVVFADWMVTVLLIVLFIATSTKAFFRGLATWKKETIMKKEAVKRLESSGGEAEYKLLSGGPSNGTKKEDLVEPEVSIIENVCWKECGLLVFVWIAFLILQIIKEYTSTCSVAYWVVNLMQIPVAVGVSSFEAVSLYKGWRTIASKGKTGTNLRVSQLLVYCFFGVLAGVVGGLLGLGGGFIMGPLFLELGVPPQVSSATATFAMMFSSSMSVVEYYLLKRFPVPYAIYLMFVATIAAFVGQHVVRKVIIILGRASIIIFILAFTIFVSAISLGGVGISNMIGKIERHEYMGFENLCKYEV